MLLLLLLLSLSGDGAVTKFLVVLVKLLNQLDSLVSAAPGYSKLLETRRGEGRVLVSLTPSHSRPKRNKASEDQTLFLLVRAGLIAAAVAVVAAVAVAAAVVVAAMVGGNQQCYL
jgi:hypothetical protein